MRYISVRDVQQKIGCDLARLIIFLHGCDTTSAVFGQGKGAILKLIATSRPAQNIVDMFMSEDATQEDISTAGLKLFVFMYNGSSCDSLNNLRYTKYMNLLAKSQQLLKPEVLPLTERDAHYHCLRVPTSDEMENLNSTLDPEKWGWYLQNNHLLPIMTG